ncbi:SMC-Scp complex subunit ScpB [Halobacillus karajensis]|uniref:Segregation and condensation protein B n=1 Tax=Halobacillus karajensis TaxID=195088 RepID=A0A024P0W7_9BACI|nr:SMC-Scp complex subunit ScpB [Halobacillus karajensis]CDQ19447.1 Segregation and condensation protein B [Halobacillus karajensis]CDQ21909.1 Segregation and condensation protein B [Halobacillus karajensis]CDQ27750.1 Segregation and condensation protein B [Halobacillus karajensis]
MELEDYKAITEGLLFAAGEEGLTKKKLTQLLELSSKDLDNLLNEMIEEYKERDRGLTLMDSQGTLHLTTKPEHASYYKRLLDSPGSTRLSQAALETLAIIAYQQPITRIEVDDLRGVKSDRAIQTLVNRGLIEEKGRKDAIGRPILYGTTKDFLIYFGLTSIDELPPLSELKQGEEEEGEADLFFEKFTEDPFADE